MKKNLLRSAYRMCYGDLTDTFSLDRMSELLSTGYAAKTVNLGFNLMGKIDKVRSSALFVFGLITLLCSLPIQNISSQFARSAYFLDNIPVRNEMNPAFQPLYDHYSTIPFLGSWSGYGVTDLKTFQETGYPMNSYVDLSQSPLPFLDQQNPLINSFGQGKMKVYEFGFRANRAYWSFSLANRMDMNMHMPTEFMRMNLQGIDATNLPSSVLMAQMQAWNYSEMALSYSHYSSETLSFGFKLKYLFGHSYTDMQILTNQWTAGSNGVNLLASADVTYASEFFNADSLAFSNVSPQNLIKPSGMGGAIDLGITYRPFDLLKFSASVNDLGYIQWKNVKHNTYSIQTPLNDLDLNAIDRSGISMNSSENTSYANYLIPHYNLGMEFNMVGPYLTLGVLDHGFYRNEQFHNEITTSLNFKPAHWLNMAVSYSAMNGRWNNVGAALGMTLKKLNFYVSADYVPWHYVTTDYPGQMPYIQNMKVPLPWEGNRMNFSLGVNYVIGLMKDADKDGISDPHDRCMYTPEGVRVDNHGCPVDTDKDGIPDYIDRCPNTPKEAAGKITEYGCPIDSDGDGVPDYMDVCPNNDPAANKTVDLQGCPKDSDSDGVPDYLDQCPDTNENARVDSKGCPLDGDGDGVPDYADLCPDTPEAAKGQVDVNGCPVDADDDGVLDYLDLCPGTPFEARGHTDSSGCLKDSDDDGVPDYKDQCPNTPYEARESVDDKGCPKDSDFDGVPDYQDVCPKLPGTPANQGCPDQILQPSSPLPQTDKKTETPAVQESLQNTKI